MIDFALDVMLAGSLAFFGAAGVAILFAGVWLIHNLTTSGDQERKV